MQANINQGFFQQPLLLAQLKWMFYNFVNYVDSSQKLVGPVVNLLF